MKVKDILEKKGRQVWTVRADATVHDALGILVQHRVGALLVTDEKGNIAGIVSERDMIRECYQSVKNIETTRVSQVMTKSLIVGTPEDEIDYIMGIMTNNRIRHIPIITKGELQGIISIGDVVKVQLRDSQYENRYLKDYLFSGR